MVEADGGESTVPTASLDDGAWIGAGVMLLPAVDMDDKVDGRAAPGATPVASDDDVGMVGAEVTAVSAAPVSSDGPGLSSGEYFYHSEAEELIRDEHEHEVRRQERVQKRGAWPRQKAADEDCQSRPLSHKYTLTRRSLPRP